MHRCQTAAEIDWEKKHSLIHLASLLTIWNIDLPKMKLRARLTRARIWHRKYGDVLPGGRTLELQRTVSVAP